MNGHRSPQRAPAVGSFDARVRMRAAESPPAGSLKKNLPRLSILSVFIRRQE